MVTMNIYDMRGRLIRVLIDEQIWGTGTHQIVWDGKDVDGRTRHAR